MAQELHLWPITSENLFVQVDQEGNRHVLLDEIIDYRVNGRVKLQDAFITTGTGMRRRCETTSWPSGKMEAQIGYH